MTKRDIFQTVLFLSILLCLYFCFSFHFLSLTKKDRNSKMQPYNEFLKSDPNILILGDSHAYNAIIMPILGPKYFSFAQGGDNIRQMFLKLDFAIKEKKRIQFVVIPGDYHTFSTHRYKNNDFTRDLLYINNYSLISDLYNANRFSVFLRWFFNYIPLSKGDDWEKYFFILTNSQKSGGSTGKTYVHLSQKEKESSSMKRVIAHLGKKIVNPKLVAILDQFIAFCKENHVKIIVIRYPFSKEYGYYAKKYPLNEVNAVFASKKSHFLAVLNYEDIFFEEPQYFFNDDHLNEKGAKIFTVILKADIEHAISQDPKNISVLSGDLSYPIPVTKRGHP